MTVVATVATSTPIAAPLMPQRLRPATQTTIKAVRRACLFTSSQILPVASVADVA